MGALAGPDWFVVRTKHHKELLANKALLSESVETFLPLLRAPLQVYGRAAWVRAPLFPCYLFARCATDEVSKIKSTPGVREIVSVDNHPAAVPHRVIDDLRDRCVDGVVDLPPEHFNPGDGVKVKLGLFRGWDGVFERYLSAPERVAILLRTVETTGIRVVLPAWSLRKD